MLNGPQALAAAIERARKVKYGIVSGLRERMPERGKNATWNFYGPQMTADDADRQLDISTIGIT